MISPLTIMTWLWRQTPDKHGYFKGDGGADKVNVWASMLRRNLTLDAEIACVTDEPEGIDPSIRIIPLPVLDATQGILVKQWSEKGGAPQCYRRLSMFHPQAAEIFGANRFVSMDLDCVIHSNVDSIFDNDCPFVMFKGTSKSRPYNGSMIQMTAGARTAVWDSFAEDPQGVAMAARRQYIGSDQAIISLILGRGEETWGVDDGVEAYGGGFMRRYGKQPRRMSVPDSVKIIFFPGPTKPWQLLDRLGFVNEHWHTGARRGSAPGGLAGRNRYRTMPAARIPPFFALDDRRKWGRAFKRVADEMTGRPTRLFIREDRVPRGARAFLRIDHPSKVGNNRNMVGNLERRGVVTLPTANDARIYLDRKTDRSTLEAFRAPEGMPAEFRVCVLGEHFFGIRLEGTQPLEFEEDDEIAAHRLAVSIVRALGIKLMSFDIVIASGQPKLVDVSMGWSVAAYADAPMVDMTRKRIDRSGADSFRVAVEVLQGLPAIKAHESKSDREQREAAAG